MTAVAEPTGWSIGSAAAHLGVAPETLRSWQRRYGVVPSFRTSGGHRRYSAADIGLLMRMQSLIARGDPAAVAARTVLVDPKPSPLPDTNPLSVTAAPDAPFVLPTAPPKPSPRYRRRSARPRKLALRGAAREARRLADAVDRQDPHVLRALLDESLRQHGTAQTWAAVTPVLGAIAEADAAACPADLERLLSDAFIGRLREHRARQLRPIPARPVLLAHFAEGDRTLPVHVIAGVLAECRIPARVLGRAASIPSVGVAISQTRASAVFLWRDAGRGSIRSLPPRSSARLVAGGPGWDGVELPNGACRATSLREATSILRATVC